VCNPVQTRHYSPLGLDFFRVGIYYFTGVNKQVSVVVAQEDVLGKAILLHYPCTCYQTIVAIPQNVLNEGHIDY
jgi:hypothetical protein